jgi:pyridoxal phosphate enzyme (YggS family)
MPSLVLRYKIPGIMSEIAAKLQALLAQIRVAEQCNSRLPKSVQLLAVSKGQPITALLDALAAGQYAFGENYLQEALPKIQALLQYPIEWHFLGQLQANKTRGIAENFSWLHSLTSLTLAQRLNAQRPKQLPPLNVCLQVKVEGKGGAGILLDDLLSLAQQIQGLPRLRLRGLMLLPMDHQHPQAEFAIVQQAFVHLQQQGIPLTDLSLGMSNDFAMAIAAGSTWVRIGQGLFGARQRRN